MSEETIKIKKSDLWKYATFLLIAIVVVGGILVFTHKSNSNTQANNGATNGGTAKVDLSPILNNPNLFPSIGPTDAKNVVIEVADFQCIWCALASGFPSWANVNTTSSGAQQMISRSGDMVGSIGKVEQLAEQGKLRFIYVPVSFFGQESTYAAEAGYCALKQGKFWEMHDVIYQNAGSDPAENTGKYKPQELIAMAKTINGLDIQSFTDCFNSNSTLNELQQSMNAAKSAGVQGTPTVYVNGKQISPTWTNIQAALQ